MDTSDPDDPAARMTRALERTRQVAGKFDGLTEDTARAAALDHPDLQFEFVARDAVVSLDLRSNRIRIWLQDGIVVSTSTG